MILRALRRPSRWALPLGAAAGALAYRALTGHCPLYRTFGLRTAAESGEPGGLVTSADAILVEKSVTIRCSPSEVYRFWRELETLPRFLSHVRAVGVGADGVSHWTVTGPAGTSVEWDAELTADIPDGLIAWSTRDGSDVRHEGAVHFVTAPGSQGTEVRIRLRYQAVGGKLGALVAGLFGEEPGQQVARDLRRLKQILEAGEAVTGARRRP